MSDRITTHKPASAPVSVIGPHSSYGPEMPVGGFRREVLAPTVHTFQCLHIPSGRIRPGEFNASHSEVFAAPDFYSHYVLEAEKLKIINAWNRQQPTEWKYWI